ncbi:hypothetical protein A7D21_01335 [Pseudomonas sp. AP19]|nr:hypothetical protein A7D21_01335 [Pseudomonas sp. AP19]
MWEPGLPAMAVNQSMNLLADTPHSRASPLPQFDLQCGQFTRWYAVNVRAGLLATAVNQSMNLLADTAHSRASPLPQFDLQCGQFTRWYAVNVGAGLARDGGESVDEFVG